jgi:hypothetical protein
MDLTAQSPFVFFFYETEKPDITLDHLIYHGDSFAATLELYKNEKTGPMSVFPFGSFAYARLDDRLEKYPEWRNAPRKPGRNAMALAPSQPQVEFWNMGKIIPCNTLAFDAHAEKQVQKHTAARPNIPISLSTTTTFLAW